MPTESQMLTLESGYAEGGYTPVAYASTDGGFADPQAFLNAADRGGTASNGKTSFTIDRAALQMTGFNPATMQPYGGWGTVGQAFTVTYGFRATAPADMPSDTEGFSRFNSTQIRQAELALQAWADVANIKFIRVGVGTAGEGAYTDNATILFSNYANGQDGASAFAMYPGNYAGATSGASAAGDVWVNIGVGSNASPLTGNTGGHVLVHEIGHAIGLDHPGDYNADGTDTVFSYADDAQYYEDSRQYTVMSYFSASNTGADYGTRYPAAPQLDDIRAAQTEYGANMTTRTGDTIYGFNSTAGREWYAATSSSSKVVFAVWDAGGEDTLDFSGYFQNGVIDLREGNFSSVGGLTGNVAIAKGAVIENAKGGSGNDAMTGNAAANELYGGVGGDTLSGGAGEDFLRGEDGNDYIVGGEAFDDTHGNMGNDTVYGGAGNDWVVGGKDQDSLFGEDGWDVVLGNLGNDTCEGGLGDDVVRGGQGNDIVRGGDGADFISGDVGFDTMTGGAGADRFHAFTGSGIDRVTDFVVGVDRVELLPGQAWTAVQVGADTVVYMGAAGSSDQLILQNVQVGSLPVGWIF